jgi:hypothetical protein
MLQHNWQAMDELKNTTETDWQDKDWEHDKNWEHIATGS